MIDTNSSDLHNLSHHLQEFASDMTNVQNLDKANEVRYKSSMTKHRTKKESFHRFKKCEAFLVFTLVAKETPTSCYEGLTIYPKQVSHSSNNIDVSYN